MTDKKADYSMEYYSGRTKIKIVDPGHVPEEKVNQILERCHKVGWSIWRDFTPEKQKEINERYESKRAD